jgi:hypothetical protein
MGEGDERGGGQGDPGHGRTRQPQTLASDNQAAAVAGSQRNRKYPVQIRVRPADYECPDTGCSR